MIAKAARVTPRGALNLIAELGVREVMGRGRYLLLTPRRRATSATALPGSLASSIIRHFLLSRPTTSTTRRPGSRSPSLPDVEPCLSVHLILGGTYPT